MWELIEQSGRWSTIDTETISKILYGLKQTLTHRKDLQASVEKVIYVLSVDYALHLIVFRCDLFTPAVQNEFIGIWKLYDKEEVPNLFSGIISSRNMHLFMPTGKSVIWRTLGRLIKALLKEKFLTMENFSDQCVILLRRDWPVRITKFIPDCLNEAIDGFKSPDETTTKIRMLLDFISDTYRGFESVSPYDNVAEANLKFSCK